MERINATTVAIEGHGVMLRGPSSSGKSDLALRLIDEGACLVADDFTDIECKDARLVAHPPPAIAGLLEVRGMGIVELIPAGPTTLAACVDLVTADVIERMPCAETAAIGTFGQLVPLFRLAPFESSATAKVRLAVRLCTGGIMRRT